MDDEWLACHFERHRPHLRAVAYRMLGSLTEADDAVQDAWLRVSRAGADEIENLGGWLTTVTARVCLNMLRARGNRHEEPLDAHIPDPVISLAGEIQPEDAAVLADSVSLALLIVLDALSPDERLALVLHDMFELPFADIAALLGRTPAAAKQLASRARRRVQGADVPADPDVGRQRQVVDAFFAAAREGDIGALIAVLHPDIQLRIDAGPRHPEASMLIKGAPAVIRQASSGLRQSLTSPAAEYRPVLVNGTAGVIVLVNRRPFTVMSFTISDGKISAIDAIADPERVRTFAEPKEAR